MIECNVTLQLHCITAKQLYIKLIFLPASKIFIWKGHKKSHKNRMRKEMWMRGVGKERRSELATISYKFSFPPRKLQGVKTVTGNKRSQCFFFFLRRHADLPCTYLDININTLTLLSFCVGTHKQYTGAPNDNLRKNICSEDDLRSRISGTFVVKFLACLPLLGFSNI